MEEFSFHRTWIRQNAPLLGTSVFFILMLGYIVHEILIGKNVDSQNIFRASVFLAISGVVLVSLAFVNILREQRFKLRMLENESILRGQVDAIESCGDGIAVLDESGHYTFMNKAHAFCYGYDNPRDLAGKHWRTLYDETRAQSFEDDVFPILNEVGEWRGRSFGRKKNGDIFPQEIRLNKLSDGRIVCIVRDITEKVQSENLLNIIKIAIEAASDGVAIADQQNKIIFMNRSFLRMHGRNPYARDDYMGTDWRLLYNEKGRGQISSMVLPETYLKGAWSGCINVMRADGSMFYADASLTKLHDGKVVGVMRDATDRIAAQAELQALHEELYQSQKMEAIGRFAQAMSSDFENLLDNIELQIKRVKHTVLPQVASAFEFEKVEKICDDLRDTVDRLQCFSLTQEMEDGVVDLSECLMRLQAKIMQTIPSNITAVVEIKTPQAYVSGQEEQIMMAVERLVEHAAKSIEDRQGKIAVILKDADRYLAGLKDHIVTEAPAFDVIAPVIRTCQAKGKSFIVAGHILKGIDYYQITISDTGQGIDEDLLPRIFDPFLLGSKDGKQTDIGLYTVLIAITSLQGAIVIDTVHGEGTSFHLFLPSQAFLEADIKSQKTGIGAA